MSVFTDLNPKIKEALKELRIFRPTDAQAQMIPPSLKGENLLLVAPTGIGKTEAAILPIFHNILEIEPKGFNTLYITPLRALNRDMMKRMTWFGERLGITVGVRHGDTTTNDRRKQVLKPPQILITTPETFQIMMTGSRLKELLKNVRHVIVDEIHELAQDERGAQLSIGMERLRVLTGCDFQRIGLSATVGTPDKVAAFLRGSSREVRIINVARDKKMMVKVSSPEPQEGDDKLADTIHSDEGTAARMRFCSEQIKAHNSTLLFVNTRDSAEILGARFHLTDPDHPIGVHHGSLSKDIRIQMEDEFKSQMINALICTSSLELGIDVGSADFTIQYNSPREVSRLVQRLGRSGHKIGEVSRGVIVTDTNDDIFESMVVARRALAGELEGTEIRSDPLVVLANQVIAHIMQMGDEKVDRFYKIVKGAYPFKGLDKDSYLDVIEQLADMRLIWLEEDEFRRTRNSRTYFFDNVSMIPDERTFRVVDITTRKHIGKLDESFVVAYAEPTASLIVRGRPWQIVSIEEDTILVEPSMGLGTVPSWSGEDIPVPYAIAQEVGRLRENENFEDYPAMANGRNKAKEFLATHNAKCPMPTHRAITIEAVDKMVIINACFGTKVNETLGKLISALLMARLGESVAVRCDPYRVMLQLPRVVNIALIQDILTKTDPNTITEILRLYLRNTAYLRWKFVYVAKKFGAIRKDADYRSINIEKVMGAFSGTTLMREAVNKTVYENLDIPKAVE
ncbi:MAG: DEAD/DEAH box helicase, partial [Thermoplasmata archaeon]|nr:DEAD/DEAH box helicase [Thermoplasmata archaeon]